jgi:hypothetical protein
VPVSSCFTVHDHAGRLDDSAEAADKIAKIRQGGSHSALAEAAILGAICTRLMPARRRQST